MIDPSLTASAGPAASPLAHPAYRDFLARRFGLTARDFRVEADGDRPAVDATLYLDRQGRATMPPLTAYVPLCAGPFDPRHPGRASRHMLAAGEQLADALATVPWRAPLVLPPEWSDARAWAWRGYRVAVRYTYLTALPQDPATIEKQVRSLANRATSRGYTCTVATDMAAVMDVLAASEARQGFTHGLDADELERLRTGMGPAQFRCYGCFDGEGRMASAFVAFHQPGRPALGWIAGSREASLPDGVAVLTYQHMLADLAAAGASAYDFGGANVPSIAASKSKFGGRLVPTYTLEQPGLRALAKDALTLARFRGQGR